MMLFFAKFSLCEWLWLLRLLGVVYRRGEESEVVINLSFVVLRFGLLVDVANEVLRWRRFCVG